MTSPNLGSDGFPIVIPGMIWDGVTEYSADDPPGITDLRACRMDGDGTRHYYETSGLNNPLTYLPWFRDTRGWEIIGVVATAATLPVEYRFEGFLNYDGTPSHEPVNQFYYTHNYRAHAARYAQHLNAGLNFDALASADEWKKLVVKQTFSSMLGSANIRYTKWDEDDPEELIVGGNYDGTLLWKRYQQDYDDVHTALCGQCDLDLYPQEFFFDADLAAFRRVWRQGIIYAVDHSTTPWSPLLFDATPDTMTVAEFYDELEANYNFLLRHYAQVVSVQDRIGT